MAWATISFEYPISHVFQKHILWLNKNANVYFSGRDTDNDTWEFYGGTAAHELGPDRALVSYGTTESTARTNYLTTDIDSDGKCLVMLPKHKEAQKWRLHVETGNSVRIYEWTPSIYLSAHEIVTGDLEITDLISQTPKIYVTAGSTRWVVMGDLTASPTNATRLGLAGYDSTGATIFELSNRVQQLAGWSFTATQISQNDMIISSEGKMIAGTGNDVVKIDSTDPSWRLYIGHDNPASAPFRVTKAGSVTLRDVSSINISAGGTYEIGDSQAIRIFNGTYKSIMIGPLAGNAVAGGFGSMYCGWESGYTNPGGIGNTTLGYQAYYYGTGDNNICIGYQAGFGLNSITRNHTRNIFIGYRTAFDIDTGIDNVLIGYEAGTEIDTASYNTAVGNYALHDGIVTGNTRCVGIGYYAGKSMGSDTVAIGVYAGDRTTGGACVLIGTYAARGALGGSTWGSNVIIGYEAAIVIDTGSNVIIGTSAGKAMDQGSGVTIVGHQAGYTYDMSGNTVLIGYQAGYNLNDNAVEANIIIGAGAARNLGDTNGKWGTIAIGNDAVQGDLTGNANDNFGIGHNAMKDISDGEENIAIGHNALRQGDDSDRNLIIGHDAVATKDPNFARHDNVMIGHATGRNTIYSFYNIVALGNKSAYNVSASHEESVFIGNKAGLHAAGGYGNIIMGHEAVGTPLIATLVNIIQNTIIGHKAWKEGTGDNNVIIGAYGAYDLITANNCIFIGPYIMNATATSTDYILAIDSDGNEGDSAHPLIYGDMANDWLKIHGDLIIAGGMNGNNATKYLNFNATLGILGYGIRATKDGYMQFRHSGGAWTNLNASGGGTATGDYVASPHDWTQYVASPHDFAQYATNGEFVASPHTYNFVASPHTYNYVASPHDFTQYVASPHDFAQYATAGEFVASPHTTHNGLVVLGTLTATNVVVTGALVYDGFVASPHTYNFVASPHTYNFVASPHTYNYAASPHTFPHAGEYVASPHSIPSPGDYVASPHTTHNGLVVLGTLTATDVVVTGALVYDGFVASPHTYNFVASPHTYNFVASPHTYNYVASPHDFTQYVASPHDFAQYATAGEFVASPHAEPYVASPHTKHTGLVVLGTLTATDVVVTGALVYDGFVASPHTYNFVASPHTYNFVASPHTYNYAASPHTFPHAGEYVASPHSIPSPGDYVASPHSALPYRDSPEGNITIGVDTLGSVLHGIPAGIRNYCFGDYTGNYILDADSNIMIGWGAHAGNGSWNVGIGEESDGSNWWGYGGTLDHNGCISIGYRAGFKMRDGDGNVLIGHQAGQSITSGAFNILIGYDLDVAASTVASTLNIGDTIYGTLGPAGTVNIKNDFHIAGDITASGSGLGGGGGLLVTDSAASLNIYSNTGDCLASKTTAVGNTAIGYHAMEYSLTSGSSDQGNVAIGNYTMQNAAAYTQCVAIGVRAGQGLLSDASVAQSVFIGYNAGRYATGGSNVVIGAGVCDTSGFTGSNNVYIGQNVQGAATGSGGWNVAIGSQAASYQTSAYYNTYIGANAGFRTTTGGNNIAIGPSAYYNADAGQHNIAIGYNCLGYGASTGDDPWYNVAMGSYAGLKVSTGRYNTLIGYQAGDSIKTGYYNTIIGDDADASNAAQNSIVIGYNATSAGNNTAKIGNGSMTWIGGQTTWSSMSDRRDKSNIATYMAGLDFVNRLQPRSFEFNSQPGVYYDGFIAQEVASAMYELDIKFSGHHINDAGKQSLSYAKFVGPLVNAVKELSRRVEVLESRLNTCTCASIINP